MFTIRAVATGGISGYIPPKSVYLKFLCGCFVSLQWLVNIYNIYTHPNQIPGYASVYDPLIVTLLLFLPVLNHPLPLELFVYLRLIIGILSLRTFAHLTVLSFSNPALNLTFSLLPITSSHPHASASDSAFDYWRYINIWLTLTLTLSFFHFVITHDPLHVHLLHECILTTARTLLILNIIGQRLRSQDRIFGFLLHCEIGQNISCAR